MRSWSAGPWRNGLTGSLPNSARINGESHTGEKKSPCSGTGWRMMGRGAALQKNICEPRQAARWMRASNMLWWQRRPKSSGAVLTVAWTGG